MKINVEYTEGAFDFSNLLDEDLFQISRKVVNVPSEAIEEMEKRGLIAEGFSKSVDAIFYQVEMENMEIRKGKVYIASPADAPEGVSVQRGPKGGYYYESGGKAGKEAKPKKVFTSEAGKEPEYLGGEAPKGVDPEQYIKMLHADDQQYLMDLSSSLMDDVPESVLIEIQETKEDFERGLDTKGMNIVATNEEYLSNRKGNFEYTPERKELHNQITRKYLDENTGSNSTKKLFDNDKPTVILLGGSPGAGKTSQLAGRLGLFDPEDFLNVAADDIKDELPEYTGANSQGVHLESKDIVKGILDHGITTGQNLILDRTLKTNAKADKMIDKFKEKGYNVIMYGMFVKPSTSMIRAKGRFEKHGRFMPYDLIAAGSTQIHDSLTDLMNKPNVDKAGLWSNEVEWGQDPIALFEKAGIELDSEFRLWMLNAWDEMDQDMDDAIIESLDSQTGQSNVAKSFEFFQKTEVVKLNETDRTFQVWASVDVTDRQGERIPMEYLEEAIPAWIERGGFIIDNHSNRVVGQATGFEFKDKKLESGQDVAGVLIDAFIFRGYQVDDLVWERIVQDKTEGASVGGSALDQRVVCEQDSCEKILGPIEIYELTIASDSARIVNPEATITGANKLAKSSEINMWGRDSCKDCMRAKALFKSKGVNYNWFDIESDKKIAMKAFNMSKNGKVPVIEIEGEVLVEPSDEEIMEKIDATGAKQYLQKETERPEIGMGRPTFWKSQDYFKYTQDYFK